MRANRICVRDNLARFWDFPDIFTKPLGSIFAIVLVWNLLGWACLLGVLALIATQAVNVIISRYMIRWDRKRRVATDAKLQKVNNFIEKIRHLRWYGWQEAWQADVLEARQHELNLRIVSVFLGATLGLFSKLGGNLFPVAAFYALTVIAKLPLRVDLIFPAIDLFGLLDSNLRDLPSLVTTLISAYVAMGRIEHFMKEPDKELADSSAAQSVQPELKNACFAWPGATKNVLQDITLSFPKGLTVVYGEVAAGKSALLQALMGELDSTGGEFVHPNEMVGYCAQTPWLQSMSIRDNILFSTPYEASRYKSVLNACALIPDMASFKHGDLSHIGENGIGLSGGQRARVALARAVYSRARILYLDDPLSALDHQTAESIVQQLLSGPLLDDRAIVLVTHRTELCHGRAMQWVELEQGKASVHEPAEDARTSAPQVATAEDVGEQDASKAQEEELAAVPDKFIEDEQRAHGRVKLRVYWKYLKSGSILWWIIVVLVLALYRFCDWTQVWFLKEWGERYGSAPSRATSGLLDFLPSPTTDVRPWLVGLLLFGIAIAVLYACTQLIMAVVSYTAAKTIFIEVVDRVAHATFRFYDITPVGRLMNRVTSDMSTVDGPLGDLFTIVAWQVFGLVSAIVVIASSTPTFLAFGFLLSSVLVYVFLQFLPTSHSLRRLEVS